MLRIPLICSGGIGDCLMLLGRVPIRFLGICGFRFNLFYTTPDSPVASILIPFLKSVHHSHLVQRQPGKFEEFIFAKMLSASQRFPRYWKVPLNMESYNTSAETFDRPGRSVKRILIQTHLDWDQWPEGKSAKIWRTENWIRVIGKLIEEGHEVALMEWNRAAFNEIHQQCPDIVDASSGSLRELCSRIAGYDCIVSVDSWVKYAAVWNSVPQVILVPDLRRGYTPGWSTGTADFAATWYFHGLLGRPEARVIGLDKRHGQFEFSLPSLEELEIDLLLSEIRLRLTISSNP